MDAIPLWLSLVALIVLVLVSGFFSIAETSMMALNRFRLGHLVRQGRRSAKLAASMLGQTDRLLGVILLFNNLINAAAATLVSVIAITVIVLACRWLWQSVGAGVVAVLALAVPFSLPAVTATLHEAMDEPPAK